MKYEIHIKYKQVSMSNKTVTADKNITKKKKNHENIIYATCMMFSFSI